MMSYISNISFLGGLFDNPPCVSEVDIYKDSYLLNDEWIIIWLMGIIYVK